MSILDDSYLAMRFLGLPTQQCKYENSKVVILPVIYDGTTSYRAGCRGAPYAIIGASRILEYFDAELGYDSTDIGICTLPPICPEVSGPKDMSSKVETVVSELMADDKFVIMLGGEHSLSIGSISAFSEKYSQMGVLQIDAHLDLRDSYEGSSYSHACAMRRIVDRCKTVVPVGIRSVAEEEYDFVVAKGMQPIYGWDIQQNIDWQEQVIAQLPQDVYITIDVDGLDPSIMPAVGTPEPGGLLWHHITSLLAKIAQKRNIVGCDVVELCPIPGMIAPDFLVSKLIYRIIGLIHTKI